MLTEMVMTAKSRWDIGSFVGSITEEHFRDWVTIKKSTYREVSLRYHAQFWSLRRNTRIMQITRVQLLCSHALETISLARLLYHITSYVHLQSRMRLGGSSIKSTEYVYALIFDTYGFVFYSRKIANARCVKIIRA